MKSFTKFSTGPLPNRLDDTDFSKKSQHIKFCPIRRNFTHFMAHFELCSEKREMGTKKVISNELHFHLHFNNNVKNTCYRYHLFQHKVQSIPAIARINSVFGIMNRKFDCVQIHSINLYTCLFYVKLALPCDASFQQRQHEYQTKILFPNTILKIGVIISSW